MASTAVASDVSGASSEVSATEQQGSVAPQVNLDPDAQSQAMANDNVAVTLHYSHDLTELTGRKGGSVSGYSSEFENPQQVNSGGMKPSGVTNMDASSIAQSIQILQDRMLHRLESSTFIAE